MSTFEINSKCRFFLGIGAISGFLAVLMGAFGAHSLKEQLEPNLFDAYLVGARYHMVHSIALILTGFSFIFFDSAKLVRSCWSFLVGILLFSGSLYLLAITGIRKLGMVTPFGGITLMLGWLFFAHAILSKKSVTKDVS